MMGEQGEQNTQGVKVRKEAYLKWLHYRPYNTRTRRWWYPNTPTRKEFVIGLLLAAAVVAVALLALHLLDILVLSDTVWESPKTGSIKGFHFALAPVVAAALIAGGSTLLSGLGNMYSQGQANQANMELAKYSYSKDLEMWNRNNAYNNPTQQMVRLKNAGLNPNLAYGSGSVAGNVSAGALPRFQAPRMEPVHIPLSDLGTALAQYQDFRMKAAQTDNLQAQNDVIRQNHALGIIREGLLSNQNLGQIQRNAKFGVEADVAYATREAQVLKAQEEARLTQAKRKEQERATGERGTLQSYQLQVAQEKARRQTLEYAKMEQEMKKLDASTQLTQKQIDWFTTKLWGDLLLKGIGTATSLVPLKKAFDAGTKLSR